MLPVYEALDIVEIISKKVGHTQPWVILANTPEGLKSFVTKLYTRPQVEQNNSVTNEVICNILSSDFGLKAPACALINIPEELVFEKSVEHQEQYSQADTRLKFASEMLPDVQAAIPSLPKNNYTKRISIETLYAFDNMIRNCDRGQQKTNLLLGSKDAFLIDHEFAFEEKYISEIDWDNFQIEDKFTRYHLQYLYLRNAWKVKKQNYFDEFQEYLRLLNINQLNTYFRQLSAEGFNTHSDSINNWLKEVKKNSTTFVTSLKLSLK